jgi:hypothetical protein
LAQHAAAYPTPGGGEGRRHFRSAQSGNRVSFSTIRISNSAGNINISNMDNQRLQCRLEVWSEKLELVERALEITMQKDYRSRDARELMLLYREKVICTNVISELRALAEEANTTSNI